MSPFAKLSLALGLFAAVPGLAAEDPRFTGRPQPFAPTSGKIVAFYLDEASIAAGYRLAAVTAGDLTHLLYAFLAICGPGELQEAAAACKGAKDFEIAVAGPLDDAALTRAFAAIKAEAPRLKLLVSIGGAMGSKPFYPMVRSAETQARFAASIRRFLTTHPMVDGIDIDWEFPTDSSPEAGEANLGAPADGAAYADLMHALRGMLDDLGGADRHYLLTSAVSTAARLTRVIDYRRAAADADLFFAMTYDYYGPWAPIAGHHASVVPPEDPGLGPIGLGPLRAAGIPAAKLVLGVAAYGRGWQVGPTGTLDGTYDGGDGSTAYRTLAARAIGPAGIGIDGFRVEYDRRLHAYSLWNPAKRIYIGYDDPRAVAEKGRIAVRDGLAGVFGWELSQDDGDLLNAMNRGVGNRATR